MSSTADAARFQDLFRAIYLRFHRRQDPQQFRPSPEVLALLEHLLATGPLSIAEAAQHFTRSQAAMSEIVTRLEERGLLARMPDDRDRRRHLVWLTEEGRRLHRESTHVLDEAELAAALARLDASACTALLTAMEHLCPPASPTDPETTR